jgi:hypothetical protein
VLEIGTTSGFVCFEMERRGADVVVFDLAEELTYDAPPLNADYLVPETYRKVLHQIRNAWWLAHFAFGSKARVAYGHANRIPATLGRFDVGVIANVMQHLQDPIGALIGLAAISDEAVVVTENDWMRGTYDDIPGMIYFDKDNPSSGIRSSPLWSKRFYAGWALPISAAPNIGSSSSSTRNTRKADPAGSRRMWKFRITRSSRGGRR